MPDYDSQKEGFWVSRATGNILPAIPLPFYPRSTGINVFQQGKKEHIGGLLNQFVRIVWLISGTCETLVQDRMQLIGEDTVCFFLYGEERMIRCVSPEARVRWLCIDGPCAETIMLAFRYSRIQTADYPAALFDKLDQIIAEDSPNMIRRKSCLCMEILAAMASEDNLLHPHEKLIPKCLTEIRRSFTDPDFGLETLCEQFSVSRTTLTRLFKRETHCSPGRYILNERMAKAIALLSGTDLPIEEVARQCGFRDRPTFTRFIRRSEGMSPSKFRSAMSKETV